MWTLIGVGSLLLAVVGWVGVRGLIAKAELEAALPLVSEIKDDLKAFDLASAKGAVTDVAAKTANARSLTSDPVWIALEGIPWAGPNLTAFRELAAITDDIARDVMLPAGALADTLDPASIKPVDGRIDVGAFADAIPVVDSMATALTTAADDLDRLDTSSAIGPIRDAHRRMQSMLKPLVPLMDDATNLVSALPGLLGADGPRHYLLVFLNNAEARSLGGHSGSWVQVDVDDGKISLARQSPVQALRTGGVPIFPLDPAIVALWPGWGTDPANSASVPDLEIAAKTASAFWANRFQVTPDAVIFMDPVALGRILGATGPIELSTGDSIDEDTAASFLLNGVYIKYPLNSDQDAIFTNLAKTLFGSVLDGNFDPKKLISAMLDSGKDHRLLVWSFDEQVKEALASLPFGVTRPTISDTVAEFGVYFTDNLGSKMAYYVDSAVTVGQAQCTDGSARYLITVTMTNTITSELASQLSNYIVNRANGSLRMLVTAYAPPGAVFIPELSTGWDPTASPFFGTDGQNAALVERVILAPQETITGTFVMTAPDAKSDRKLSVYITPMARPVPVTTVDFTC